MGVALGFAGLLAFFSGASLQSGEALAASTKTVQVMNGLPETLCDPTQWDWIINQIDTEVHAPAVITVNWNNGTEVRIPLDKTTPGVVADHSRTLHLTDGPRVTNA